jgi:hypothetical protein
MSEKMATSTQDLLFQAWAAGISRVRIAQSFGCSTQEVDAAVEVGKAARPSLLSQNPRELFEEFVIRAECLREDLAVLASKEVGSVRLRAIAARFNVEQYVFELYQAAGLVPRLRDLRIVLNGVQAADVILEVLDRNDLLTDEVADELQARFEQTDWILDGEGNEAPS